MAKPFRKLFEGSTVPFHYTQSIRNTFHFWHTSFLGQTRLSLIPVEDTIIIHSQYVSGRGNTGYDCFSDPKEFSKFRNNQNCPIPRKHNFLMKSPALSKWMEPVSLNANLIHTFMHNYFYHFTFALDEYISWEQLHKATFLRTACVIKVNSIMFRGWNWMLYIFITKLWFFGGSLIFISYMTLNEE